MSRRNYPTINIQTSKQAGDYLFDTTTTGAKKTRLEISRALDMRTVIKGSSTMALLTYLGILRDAFDCEEAQHIGDVIKRLAISEGGLGRSQAVEVLKGNIPWTREIPVGQA